MPDTTKPGSVLWNVGEGRNELVEGSRVEAALKSGAYLPGPPSVTSGEGGDVVETPESIGPAEASGQRPSSAVSAKGVEARAEARRAAVDTTEDQLLTFAEGVVDAASFGLLHETGKRADLRREVHAGTALLGQLTGFAVGMKLPGPMRSVAKVGEEAGEAAAKAVLGKVVPGGRKAIAVAAAGGAGEMSALMAAGSIGYQVNEAVNNDKDFSGAAVVHEAGLGAILGGATKFLGATFSRAAKRYEIKAGGHPFLDPESAASHEINGHIANVRSALDSAVESHEQRLGVLNHLASEGKLPVVVPEFMEARAAALKEARAAARKLSDVEFKGAVDESPERWAEWHSALEDYQAKVENLDGLMRRKHLEILEPQTPGEYVPGEAPQHVPTEHGSVKLGKRRPGDKDPIEYIEEELARSPELRAEYERLHGQPWEPLPAAEAEKVSESMVADEANLGGKVSPTSELGTPVAKSPRRAIAEAPTPEVEGPGADFPSDLKFEAKNPEFRPGIRSEVADRVFTTKPQVAPLTEADVPFEARLAGTFKGLGERTPFWQMSPERQMAEAFSDMGERIAAHEAPIAEPGGFSASVRGAARGVEHQPLQPLGEDFSPAAKEAVAGEAPGHLERARAPMNVPTKVSPREIKPAAPEYIDRATPVNPGRENVPHVRERRAHEVAKEEGRRAVERYVREWHAEAERLGPTYSPGDRAAQEIQRVLNDIRQANPGAELAGNTDLAKLYKLPTARSSFGAALNDLYIQRRLADVVARASGRAGVSGLGTDKVTNWLVRRSLGKMGAGLVGGAIGAKVGGPLGYFIGAAMAAKYLGFSGRVAGAAGRMYIRAVKAGEQLLRGQRSAVVARTVAGNRPYQYSSAGPIKDPRERMGEVRRIAQSPQLISELVSKQAGDLNIVAPNLTSAVIGDVLLKLTTLAGYIPPPQTDAFGRPIPPSEKDVRRFLEAENAVHDLEGLLTAVGRGSVTRVQAEVLQMAHPKVHQKIAAMFLSDPEKLAKLERAKLRTVEMILGVPLTPGAADPMFLARQQANWVPMVPPQPINPTQSLKIPGAGGPPSETPTPSQSYGQTGRAPGN